jgi:hypothetical protein
MDYSLLLFVEENPKYVEPKVMRKLTSMAKKPSIDSKEDLEKTLSNSLQKQSITSEAELLNGGGDKDFFVLQSQHTNKFSRKQTFPECKSLLVF